jgi:hypothetical protein
MKDTEGLKSRIRGWLPEEPTMPKSKLKRALPPIAVLLTVTAALSLFSSALTFNQPAAAPTAPTGTQSVPSFASVKFNGVLQENNSFILVLTNGTHINSKDLTLSLSLNEKKENEYAVHIAVESGNFSDETTVSGYISDGKLMIGDTASVFLTKTDELEKGNWVLLSETDGWKLTANVGTVTGKPATAIDDQLIEAIMVTSSQLTKSGWPLQLTLGYDSSTGILVYSGWSLSDVLLKAVGVELILGGSLELASYSDNLNLKLASIPPSGQLVNFGFFLFILGLSSFAALIATTMVYVVHERTKRDQVDPLTAGELRDASMRKYGRKGW